MPVKVTFPSLKETTFNAIISEVSPSADANTTTYPVKVMITDKDERIKSGMAANVAFEFSAEIKAEKLIVIPANAVGENDKGRFVFLIEGNEAKAVVKKQSIEIGDLTPEGFEVTKGLKAGERIATAGLQTLLDGQSVKLK